MMHHLDQPTHLLAGAATVAALTLAGSFGFQFIGGLEPSPLCIWPRWPYAIGILLIIIGLLGSRKTLARHLHRTAAGTLVIRYGLSGVV